MRFSGKKVKSTREAFGWSVVDLSFEVRKEGAKIHPATIKNYENGSTEPKASRLVAIANALDLPINSLFVKDK